MALPVLEDRTFLGDVTVNGNLVVEGTATLEGNTNITDGDAITFGTGGLDLLMTADGTDMVETGTGDHVIADGVALALGTGKDITLTGDGTDVLVAGSGDLVVVDSTDLVIGTGKDLTIVHGGTNTNITSATGDLIVDNTAATGSTVFQLGTDTSATSFEVKDDTGNINLSVDGAGAATILDGVASGTARRLGGSIATDVAAGSSLTSSASETVLTSTSIPANMIKAGTVLKVKFMCRVTADNGATTLIGRVRLGPTTLTGTALITSSTVDTSSGHVFAGEFTLIGRAAPGAAAACVGLSNYMDLGAVGGAMINGTLNSTNFATNGVLLLELTGIWSASDANAVQSEIWNVEITG